MLNAIKYILSSLPYLASKRVVAQLAVIIEKVSEKSTQQTNKLMGKIDSLLELKRQRLQLATEMFKFEQNKSKVISPYLLFVCKTGLFYEYLNHKLLCYPK